MARVYFEGSVYSVAPGESTLDALLRGGANVEFSCRKGTCQVCMLQVEEGTVGPDGVAGLRHDLVEADMFLPCCSHPTGDVHIRRPDRSRLFTELFLAEKRWLSPSICELSFDPGVELSWHAGQFVNLRREDGVIRSYSIASIREQDYFLTVHVRRIDGGTMSRWLCDELEPGAVIEAQGPVGTCYYDPEQKSRDLLLLGTGSGLSPLYGVCRDALRQGHEGQIWLYHSSRTEEGLYLRDELTAMADAHDNFHYLASLTQEFPVPPGVGRGRIVEIAFAAHRELAGWIVHLAGVPEMVEDGRQRALLAGADRVDVHADPFEYARPYLPDDRTKIASVQADPELWAALGHGELLNEILHRFYDRVFVDPRLAPFFHRVTKDRAIQKQYSFLADLFSGTRNFFGLRPFNAHHWMVISDELFDYREALMDEILVEVGLAEPFRRRWASLHELFRREIVKSSPRGLIVDGVEQELKPPEEITIDCSAVCDGCFTEMPAGSTGYFHAQGGEIFCARCSATPAHQMA